MSRLNANRTTLRRRGLLSEETKAPARVSPEVPKSRPETKSQVLKTCPKEMTPEIRVRVRALSEIDSFSSLREFITAGSLMDCIRTVEAQEDWRYGRESSLL